VYRVTIVCPGVPEQLGTQAAVDIQKAFADHRRHHQRVRCSFASGELMLVAENDFDSNGLALRDEFSDCISAFLTETPDGSDLFVKSVERI
jgi:hypothetical protein